ncbi:MAG TPA: flagellar export chaperone FliS [Candidatus Hydrogenedentes bacterium]|nr:flagellar export chaperone FliS [Candidatus Hydrogenedentota bacterium]HQE82838.1 flagellar export chaperone FliS [Candidatus Hydrogenedentota bacterium]HQH51940.1 flagellar export chaperone FliS [Candidatus Hydrogenedentota bacterium]HQM47555.1 flagellar export chaperone FliS [Candidatus Hydrogenedentota bacterium]
MADAQTALQLSAYKKIDVETTSQGKLIVLLFNGAIQRAEEAKRHIAAGSIENVHNNLIRAQEILGELRGALDMKMGAIAQNLDRIYEYLQHLLIDANLRKSVQPIEECLAHLTTLRDTWKEAFQKAAQENHSAHSPLINQHGASLMNIKG